MVVIEDMAVIRSWLRDSLRAEDAEIVGQYSTGGEGIAAVVSDAPDVAIIDLALPDMHGVEVIRAIAARRPSTRMLVLTVSEQRSDVVDSLQAGAMGYLLKRGEASEVRDAIRGVAEGEAVISATIDALLLEHIRSLPPDAEHPGRIRGEALARLTDREVQILKLLAAGLENSEIARELHISTATVKNHVAQILRKLDANNRVQAAAQAIRSGLV